MNSNLPMAGLIGLGLMAGSIYGTSAQTNAPAPSVSVQPQEAPPSNDANAAPDADQNPYVAITKANVFQLKDPPPPPRRDDPAILNLPKINITGFRKREGEPLHALFATVPKDAKESPKYFNLAEGEKEGLLELKRIDPSQEFVEVVIAGTPTTLTVKSNSFVQPLAIAKNLANAIAANQAILAHAPQPPPVQNQAPAYNNQNSGGVIVAGPTPNQPNAVGATGEEPLRPREEPLQPIPTRGIRSGAAP